jgi:membrane protease YdiL (CAAX protease family)
VTVAVLAVLAVHNLVTNLWAEDRWYVRINLATALCLVAIVGPDGVGMSPGDRPLAGVAAASVVLGALGLAATVRPGLLADQRMAGVDARGTVFRALVRIPLGTVVLEEVAFRGVLPALMSPVAASGLFGLWHVLPTARALRVNGVARSPWIIAAAVSVTAVAGHVLWGLRVATGSLLAPALVHAAANGGAVVATYLEMRRRAL